MPPRPREKRNIIIAAINFSLRVATTRRKNNDHKNTEKSVTLTYKGAWETEILLYEKFKWCKE